MGYRHEAVPRGSAVEPAVHAVADYVCFGGLDEGAGADVVGGERAAVVELVYAVERLGRGVVGEPAGLAAAGFLLCC